MRNHFWTEGSWVSGHRSPLPLKRKTSVSGLCFCTSKLCWLQSFKEQAILKLAVRRMGTVLTSNKSGKSLRRTHVASSSCACGEHVHQQVDVTFILCADLWKALRRHGSQFLVATTNGCSLGTCASMGKRGNSGQKCRKMKPIDGTIRDNGTLCKPFSWAELGKPASQGGNNRKLGGHFLFWGCLGGVGLAATKSKWSSAGRKRAAHAWV